MLQKQTIKRTMLKWNVRISCSVLFHAIFIVSSTKYVLEPDLAYLNYTSPNMIAIS